MESEAVKQDRTLTAMIVEDEEVSRAIAEVHLGNEGFKTVAMESAIAALTYMEEKGGEIDFILLDRNMPGMEGLEFAKIIKCDPRYENVPIIMLTGMNGDKDMFEAKREGVEYYLNKPIEADSLIKVIREVADKINAK